MNGTRSVVAFRSLGFTFTVHTSIEPLERASAIAFEPCATTLDPDECALHFELRQVLSGEYAVECDGRLVTTTEWPDVALDYLVWEVNQQVVRSRPDQLVVHAAAVVLDDRAVVVPVDSGSGKSTLCAALVEHGFDYLSDEAVAIEPETSAMTGHRRAIALKAGAWPLFPASAPAAGLEPFMATTRYVTPGMLGGRSHDGSARPALVVVPDRSGALDGPCEPMHRADALTLLAQQCFNFDEYGPARLDVLARVVRSCRCYRVDTTSLPAACATITGLLEREGAVA